MNALYLTIVTGLSCLLVYTSAAGIIDTHPDELIESPPQYEFHYSVHDSHTGDVKDQFEHRRGEYVTGRYSLIEPDGQRRIVEYSSDPLLGFNAQVRREVPVVRQLSAINIEQPIQRLATAELVEEWPAQPRH